MNLPVNGDQQDVPVTPPDLDQPPDSYLVRRMRSFALLAAGGVACLGCIGIVFWLFGRQIAGTFIEGIAGSSPGTSFVFLLSSGSLIPRRDERRTSPSAIASVLCAAVVFAIGIGTIGFYVAADVGLFGVVSGPREYLKSWITPVAAFFSIIAGLALLWLDSLDKQFRRASQILCVVLLMFAIASLGASLFRFIPFGNPGPRPLVKAITAAGFVLLSLATLCFRPDRGGMRVITSDAVGGEVVRRLLPASLLAPILLSALAYVGYQLRWYDWRLGLILLTTVNSAVLTIIVWRVARELNVSDAHRKLVEKERNDLNMRLQRAMTETHHRVRNNLQIICALADMQTMSGEETVPVSEVKRISSQVQALAAVHDILTRESKVDASADTLSADEVLGSLAMLIQQTTPGRAIRVHADDSRVTARQASALVVVANELILNALKNSELDVDVTFSVSGGHARLVVQDAGAGFPAGFDVSRDANTGLELVQQVSSWDLQGSVEYANGREGGGRVTVQIPVSGKA